MKICHMEIQVRGQNVDCAIPRWMESISSRFFCMTFYYYPVSSQQTILRFNQSSMDMSGLKDLKRDTNYIL